MIEIEATLQNLERALNAPTLAPRLADGCARLIERLRKPVCVGVFGTDSDQRETLFRSLIGADFLNEMKRLPTIEVTYGEAMRIRATLDDGSHFVCDGIPNAPIALKDPVFLEISLPNETLRKMTFLCPAAGTTQAEQSAALAWAARRTDIALWCTNRFELREEAIWTHAPARLKNHAYLVVANGENVSAEVRERAVGGFDHVIALSEAAIAEGRTDALLHRLIEHIDMALAEDVDAARLLLHRCSAVTGVKAVAQKVIGTNAAKPRPVETATSIEPSDADIALLSEPFLYLKRRARNLAESLDWSEEDGEWAQDVLDHCSETANGLLDRASAWPEDNPIINGMKDLINEAAELYVLLVVEGGPMQAEDAAILVFQLRTEFESRLTPNRLAS